MGKIDLNARILKREAGVNYDTESELAGEYARIWGKTNEVVKDIELGLLTAFKKRNGKRQAFKLNKEKISQIKLSAKDIGIITPLIVRKYEDGYQIIAGHHRYQAAKELGLLTVPCIVRDISDESAEVYVNESNIQRMKLSPTEYGAIFEGYMEIRKDLELTVKEISEKFGVSVKSMYRYINVMACIPEIQELFDEERINIDCVDVICKLDKNKQSELAADITGDKLGKNLTLSILKGYLNKEEVKEVKPKKFYRSKIYNTLDEKYNLDKEEWTEKNLDELVISLLEEHFSMK